MTWLLIAGAAALGAVFASIGWLAGYHEGMDDGRLLQAVEDRDEVERAVIDKARAEQLAETWARRARALLHAHFGPEHKP